MFFGPFVDISFFLFLSGPGQLDLFWFSLGWYLVLCASSVCVFFFLEVTYNVMVSVKSD